jgi:uncharacterized protein (TIGR03086 family)
MFQQLAPNVMPLSVGEGIANGVAQVREAVRYQIKYGAKVIKVSASGGVMSHTGPAGAQHYSSEEFAAIAEEAHRWGYRSRERGTAHGPDSIGGDAMELDLLDLYERASSWSAMKVSGAAGDLDAPTPCDEWDVRTLMNHMLDTQHYFVAAARGEDVSPPSPSPPDLLGDDPAADFDRARSETLRTFSEPGVIEKTGPALGIAFGDQLLHGWDLAKATAQDATMPDGLPEAAYEMIHGRFTEDQRKGVFKPEVEIGEGASAQERLLAYTGRDPS